MVGGWVNDVCSAFGIIRNEVAILELARYKYCIPREGKCQGSPEVLVLVRAVGEFIDAYCQTRRCFKGIYLEDRGKEDLVPALMDTTALPVTRRLSKFVVCTIGKGCLQKKNKFIPI